MHLNKLFNEFQAQWPFTIFSRSSFGLFLNYNFYHVRQSWHSICIFNSIVKNFTMHNFLHLRYCFIDYNEWCLSQKVKNGYTVLELMFYMSVRHKCTLTVKLCGQLKKLEECVKSACSIVELMKSNSIVWHEVCRSATNKQKIGQARRKVERCQSNQQGLGSPMKKRRLSVLAEFVSHRKHRI